MFISSLCSDPLICQSIYPDDIYTLKLHILNFPEESKLLFSLSKQIVLPLIFTKHLLPTVLNSNIKSSQTRNRSIWSEIWFRKYFKNEKSLGAEMKTVTLLKLSNSMWEYRKTSEFFSYNNINNAKCTYMVKHWKHFLRFLASILQLFLPLTLPHKTLFFWSIELNLKIMLNEYKSVGIFKIKPKTIYSNRIR